MRFASCRVFCEPVIQESFQTVKHVDMKLAEVMTNSDISRHLGRKTKDIEEYQTMPIANNTQSECAIVDETEHNINNHNKKITVMYSCDNNWRGDRPTSSVHDSSFDSIRHKPLDQFLSIDDAHNSNRPTQNITGHSQINTTIALSSLAGVLSDRDGANIDHQNASQTFGNTDNTTTAIPMCTGAGDTV